MKRARKASNIRDSFQVHFKSKKTPTMVSTGATKNTPVKAQNISLLIELYAINMQLHQN